VVCFEELTFECFQLEALIHLMVTLHSTEVYIEITAISLVLT